MKPPYQILAALVLPAFPLIAATPDYSGSLTLESNALLDIGNPGGSENAALASGIILHAGAQLRWNINANTREAAVISALWRRSA